MNESDSQKEANESQPSQLETACAAIPTDAPDPTPESATSQSRAVSDANLEAAVAVPYNIEAIDEHFRRVQYYQHTHGIGSMVIENAGWLCTLAMRHGGVLAQVIPNWVSIPIDVKLAGISGFFDFLRQTFNVADLSLCLRHHEDHDLVKAVSGLGLEFRNYITGYRLTGSTFQPYENHTSNYEVKEVETDVQVQEFAHVVDLAYHQTYGVPRGIMLPYFPALISLRNPHVRAFIGYLDGKPTRTEAVYKFENLASLSHAARTQEGKGSQYSDPVVSRAIEAALEMGAEQVLAQALPSTKKIAERRGGVQIAVYSTWAVPHKKPEQGVVLG